ncbi:hypothetical protein ACJMK2_023457 [Sinanodonta woodiana]|uniref:Mitochondrial GTPase 1 n=1 Tax=Sinanodonta woodiana TaxID=1069815 RepID=A0ABD3T510_SINWO
MARQTFQGLTRLREKFILPDNNMLRWFPGHMAKGLDQIQSTLKNLDAIIEVHDARIPFAGRNPQIRNITKIRPHILLLTKSDLADDQHREKIVQKIKEEGIKNIFYMNCKHKYVNKYIKNTVFPCIWQEIASLASYRKEGDTDYHLMIVGVPNVGKSTILNKLRETFTNKGKGALVGAKCGVTTSVMNKVRINNNPSVFVYDTPGILTPYIPDIEVGMRLALCACIPYHLVGEERIVDYMLFWMNKRKHYAYMEPYNIPEPTDDVYQFLTHVAKEKKMILKVQKTKFFQEATEEEKFRPNFHAVAGSILRDFQNGVFGKILLDDEALEDARQVGTNGEL